MPSKERAAQLRAENKCAVCAVRPPDPDSPTCAVCKETIRKQTAKRRADRAKATLCIECGKRKARKGETRCDHCAKRNAERVEEHRDRHGT